MNHNHWEPSADARCPCAQRPTGLWMRWCRYSGIASWTDCVLALLLGLACGGAGAGPFAYITNMNSSTVSVIDTATNAVVGAPITLSGGPYGVAINRTGTRVYITLGFGAVSVIDTATNTVIGSPIPVGSLPTGVAVNPAGTRVYVTNQSSDSVSVIDTSTNTVVVAAIPVGNTPLGVAINPAGTRVYVANALSNNLSVIDTSTNTVVGARKGVV